MIITRALPKKLGRALVIDTKTSEIQLYETTH